MCVHFSSPTSPLLHSFASLQVQMYWLINYTKYLRRHQSNPNKTLSDNGKEGNISTPILWTLCLCKYQAEMSARQESYRSMNLRSIDPRIFNRRLAKTNPATYKNYSSGPRGVYPGMQDWYKIEHQAVLFNNSKSGKA